MKTPSRVIENLLIKVGKFVFPVDFVILDMGKHDIPIVLGRPFLATAQATIDMSESILTLRVGHQEMHYTATGKEFTSNDPIDMAKYVDEELEYQIVGSKRIDKQLNLS